MVSAWVAVEDLINHWLVDDDLAGELIEPHLVAAGVITQRAEGAVDIDAASRGEHALGLLDHHTGVQRVLQLIDSYLRLIECMPLPERCGSRIDQGMGKVDVLGGKFQKLSIEQTYRTANRCE